MEEMPHYDLTVVISAAEGIDFDFIYKNTSFAKETIVRLAHHFSTILAGVVKNVENSPREIEILSEQEKQQLLKDFNRTAVDYPDEKTIYELFAGQMERTPGSIALVGPHQVKYRTYKTYMTYISYRELNESAGQLAYKLIEKGVQPDTIVGIMMERSIEMVVGILGILKVGCAYLPIDPEFPEERIKYILEDSKINILVNKNNNFIISGRKKRKRESFKEIEIVNCQLSMLNKKPFRQRLNTPPKKDSFYLRLSPAPVTSLAYIIYTSGSTGRPKGVMVEQSPVVNLLWAMQRRYPLTEKDAYLLKTSYLFDVSVTELFGWFLLGGRLAVLEPGGEKDPKAILDMIARQGVTHINFVPSMFHTFVEVLEPEDIAKLSGLKYIFLAGEALLAGPVNRFNRFNMSIVIENIYGPTEAAVYASWFSLAEWNGESSIPIGKPLPNVKLYILDMWGSLQPLEVPGELCIGGVGLARGYLNNQGLTAQSFRLYRSYQSNKSYILYHTGDLARWLSDGNIEFLGRMDSQVKIRGFRIELGEIESRLSKHPGIKEAVVLAQEQEKGDKYICAYFVSVREYTISGLREYLHKELPGYMIPAYFVRLEKFPLTPSGKIDRKALPAPGIKSKEGYVAPRNGLEEKLVEIWAGVLGIEKEKIGINDNFFHLGGHSLKATILAGRIHKELKVNVPLAEIFKTTHIRGLAVFIKKVETQRFFSIGVVEKKEYYILSSAQRRLLVLQQMDENGIAYNIPSVWQLEGELDRERLAAVFRQLIQRHDSLRTSFHMVNEEPVQVIHDQLEFKIEYHDLSPGDSLSKVFGSPEPFFQKGFWPPEAIVKKFIRFFDLTQAPLFRVELIKLLPTPSALRSHPSQEGIEHKHILVVDMHHIISDGGSAGILVREFMELYAREKPLALRLQYKDYSEWQQKQALEKSLSQQEVYWLKEFSGEVPVLDLPLDYPRPSVRDFAGRSISFEIGGEESDALKSLADQQGVTLFMLLLSLYTVCLSRLCGQEDIVVGTPIAGRRHADLQPLMGMFVNTLVLRHFPVGPKTFIQFLQEVKESSIKAFENQDYLFEDLLEQVEVERDTGRNPLFDTMFALQDIAALTIQIPGLQVQPLDYETRIAKFDLTLMAVERGEKLFFIFEYCSKLFKQETIRRFSTYFKTIATVVLENPMVQLSGIDILSGIEKKQILFDFNNTVSEYPGGRLIHQLFEEEAEKWPDKIAVGYENHLLSYHELNRQTQIVAVHLKNRGVKPGMPVGIMIGACLEMIVGVMAILKAGGGYLPIDPDYPEERKQYMLKDSGGVILLTRQEIEGVYSPQALNNSPQGSPWFGIWNLEFGISPRGGQLAYIIYTSGSTGKPKGVMVEHQNVVRLVKNTNFIQFRPGDRILQTGALEFDASTFEIWGALLNGLTLYLVPRDKLLDTVSLKNTVYRNHISIMWMTAPLFNQVVNSDVEIFSKLRNLLVGGDVLSPSHISRVRERFPQLNIINGYGPTENTTFSTTFLIDREYKENIPIGKPIANSTAYIVDKNVHWQPIGIVGELWVGGDGVSRGYMNNPELTSEKFDHDLWDLQDYHDRNYRSYRSYQSHISNLSYYKTGDLARWLPDGNIEFLGRIDHQVKIRGFRVELEEIENQLLTHGKVKEAIVLVRKDNNDKYLCAYIVAKPGETNPIVQSQLREYLSDRLPDYMVPSYFTQLDGIPLNSNGKVDRKALPEPEMKTGENYIAPRNELEKKLVELWSETLHVEKEKISINDNFFHLGGHSLKATTLAARIHKELKVNVPLAEIFKTSHIRGLAAFIKNAETQRFFSVEVVEKKEYYILSSAQRRLLVLQQMDEDGIAYNIPSVWQLEGGLDREKFAAVFRQLVRRHESLRTSFHTVNEEPVQRINEEVEVKIEVEEKRQETEDRPDTYLSSGFIRPFDLSKAPLFRVGLIKILHTPSALRSHPSQEGRSILIVDMHHIISDGVSAGILVREFMELYAREKPLALRLQYKDYSEWQKKQVLEKFLSQQEAYWLKEFSGEVPVLDLPLDYPRPSVQDFAGRSISFEIVGEETNALKSLAAEQGVTLFMLLLSLYTLYLSRLCGQEDIVVGTPIAGRRHADLQPLMGMFVNTLVLRNFPDGRKPFTQFLQEVKERSIKAFENQDYLYEDLVEKVDLERDPGRNPLFDTMFALQDFPDLKIQIPGLQVQPFDYETRISKFDLTLMAVEKDDNLLFIFEDCTGLFKEETIRRFTGYFSKTVSTVIESPGIRISEIEIIGEEEKNRVLYEFNGTTADYPKDKMIHRLFEEQVERTPDNTALHGCMIVWMDGEEGSITYKELNERCNRLAGWLIKKGVQPETMVGIMIERSIEMIVGILGILKSGAAYLPLNPEQPGARTHLMMADTGAKLLISTDNLKELHNLLPSQLPGFPLLQATTLAYVIYTSGSTGIPRGVLVTHANFSPLVHWGYKYLGLSSSDRTVQNLSYYFDWSVWEIFITLTAGASLYMVSGEVVPDAERYLDFIYGQAITALHITPTHFRSLISVPVGQRLSTLRYLSIGAEKLTYELVERTNRLVHEKCRVYNMYGPTEATIMSAVLEIAKSKLPFYREISSVPIGKNLGNNVLLVLDRYMHPSPLEVPGELYIGGEGVARGYLNKPELTLEKFIFYRSYRSYMTHISKKLYKTGDLVRYYRIFRPEGFPGKGQGIQDRIRRDRESIT